MGMRILLFNLATDVNDPILGFATRWIWALAKQVEFIHVITMRAGRVEVPDNVRVYSVGKENGYSEPRRVVEFYRSLLHVLCEDHIDICFSHMMPLFTALAGPLLKTKGIPIVTWYAHPSLTWILKLAHRLSDRMISSVATAYPYKHDKLTVVGQGIDTDLFFPDGRVSSGEEDPSVILCVGRLSLVKDHPTLLEAAALLRRRYPHPFRVVIVGGPAGPQDEPYVQLLHQLVQTLNLQDIIHFEPPVPITELLHWYQRCTVHVNLTPTGFGDKVALEAIACGKMCLVANEGFRETLGEYAAELLFRFRDAEDLSDRLAYVLSMPETQKSAIGS